ncbi:uncharacterized protein LOC117127762 [Brassica rapa]|uniref:uncharacterized protein LOC117127762 n=1 Tax=Brassica campestris TaxID=3711 RepID=UPI00142DBA05|nr:uncharacterized protein LOC117127762 [Brassica rapa]
MKKFGTVRYPGGTDPFEASTWLRNLEKHFRAIHCPDNFKKDVATYYLTKDASDWWDNVEEYYMGREIDWEYFKTKFERKYFPPEAKDRLEIQFLELTQGNRKVREYEAEFTKLRKYSHYGERNEEIAVNVEKGMEKDQAMMKHAEPSRRTEGLGGRKAPDYITCFSCGEKGHYANSCPHNRQVTLPTPPTRLAIEPAPKRQEVGKQVNALELGKPEPQQPHQGPITGTLCVGGVYVHVLFDSGATHSFVIPEVVSSFKGTFTRVKVGVSVRTPGNHNLRADSCVLRIPIYLESMVYPADLLVVPLGQHEVILGMDWLSRYYTQLDCGRGRITLEESGQPLTTYYGICPSAGVSLVSALRVEKYLIEGEGQSWKR